MSENMNETMNENEGVTVTLTLDNDETLECAVLTIYEAAGRQYIALLPLDENGEESEESDVYIYRFSETEDGEPNLENIEDDDEYDAAADKFDEWMDSLEFDEIDLNAPYIIRYTILTLKNGKERSPFRFLFSHM